LETPKDPPAIDTEDRPPVVDPPPVETILGAKADAIINLSPKLRADWQRLLAQEWSIVYGKPGEGSKCDWKNSTIIVDPAQAKGDPNKLAVIFAHEVGHAVSRPPYDIPGSGLTREEYVEANVDRQLASEGDAAFENARYQEEIALNGGKSDEIGYAGKRDDDYQRIYDAYKAGQISESEARHQMGQVMAQEGVSGTNNTTYRDTLTQRYENQWSEDYSDVPDGSVAH
jgi:hypothetical protein